MGCQRAFGRFALARWNPYIVVNADFGDPQDALYRLNVALDCGPHFGRLGWDLAHFQRAGKGAEQSSADGGDHVIESRGQLFIGLNSIEFFDRAVDAVAHRLREVLNIGVANRPFDLFEPDAAGVNQFSHLPINPLANSLWSLSLL